MKKYVKASLITLSLCLFLNPLTAEARDTDTSPDNPLVVTDTDQLNAEICFRNIHLGQENIYFKTDLGYGELNNKMHGKVNYLTDSSFYFALQTTGQPDVWYYDLTGYRAMEDTSDFDQAYATIDAEARKVLNKSKNNFDIISNAFSLLQSNGFEYNYAVLKNKYNYPHSNYDSRGSVLYKSGVCGSRSNHLAMLLSRCGIPAFPYVYRDEADFHSKTALFVDGAWYTVDPTNKVNLGSYQFISKMEADNYIEGNTFTPAGRQDYLNIHLAKMPNPQLLEDHGIADKLNKAFNSNVQYYLAYGYPYKEIKDKDKRLFKDYADRALLARYIYTNFNLKEKYPNVTYTDLTNEPFKYEMVQVGKSGIMGYGGGKFNPKNFVNRAQLVAVLNRAYGLNTSQYKNKPSGFSDVKQAAWYHNDMTCAQEKGLLNGYPDKTARPNNGTTIKEMFIFIENYQKAKSEGRI